MGAATVAGCPDLTEPEYIVTLEPAAPTVYLADTLRFTAVMHDAAGEPVAAEFTWSVQDDRIASVDATGLVRALQTGRTAVRATAPRGGGEASLTVLEDQGETLTISPPSARLFPDATARFTATLRDRHGEVLPSNPTWTSSNTAVATIDAAGLARGITPGHATIRATANGLAADAALTVAEPPASAVFVGAGDIARCDLSGDERTADLLDDIEGTVFTAGDNAYPDGTVQQYAQCYGSSWGRHKARTRPTAGNHEYHTFGATGYFDYFGAAAGDPDEGYYSFDLGGWHIIALNSNLVMSAGSPQERWLREDLARHPSRCTLAIWHHPRFSSGRHGSLSVSQGAWDALYEAGAEVIIASHDHSYERFAPQDPTGRLDLERGIRQFVVGTGGSTLYEFPTVLANSEVRSNEAHGVLKLTLHPDRYEWEFVPVAGASFRDSGAASCR